MSNVFQKLNLKDQSEIHVLNAPPSFDVELARLAGVRVHRDARGSRPITFSLAFVTKRKEVDRLARIIGKRAEGDALVWFAYPKQSSKKYECDFHRDTGWASLGDAGFEGVRQVAIDEDWSALRFRRVEFVKKMTRDEKRALTRQGRARVARRAT